MIGFFKYFFIAFLCYNVLFAQESSNSLKLEQISEKKWENIVDYLNAEVTAMAMLEYKNKKKGLDANEEIGLSEISLLLIENSIVSPVSSSDLKNILNTSWVNTFNNISTPIDSLKNYSPKVLDTLFNSIENILVFRKSEIFQTLKFEELKNVIILSQKPRKSLLVNLDKESDLIIPESSIITGRRAERKSFDSYWMVPIILLLVSTILFFTKWRTEKQKNRKIEKNRCREAEEYTLQIKDLDQKLNNQNEKYSSPKSKSAPLKNENYFQKNDENSEYVLEKKSLEVDWKPSAIIREPENLFSGKPTIENRFANLSKTPINNQTIYKLTIHDDGLNADFEVDLVDDFITREVTNAPDEYLYRVCNQVNSNKDFSREIITTKKGLAVLIDGNWVVKEANKATIKFQ